MRRLEKAISERTAIESIIRRSSVCRLALSENGHPYIVPLCFGYHDNTLFFHSAREGKKVDILMKNNAVCFEFDIDHELVRGDNPCAWGMKYRSVVGFGRASIVDDPESKRQAFDIIMRQYADRPSLYRDDTLQNALIIKVEIEGMTGKQSGY